MCEVSSRADKINNEEYKMAKRYTAQFKFQAVIEVLTEQQSVAQAAKERNVHPNSINKMYADLSLEHKVFKDIVEKMLQR